MAKKEDCSYEINAYLFFPIVLVCFPCVTKQQMLVQVVHVLL